jgi:threonine/homoserine/homoserine lactone efflux protein
MELSQYFLFIAAAGLLAVIPGPGILFVLAQTSKGGKNAGISASLGTGIGGMFHVFAGAVGISTIVYSSAVAFEVVKILGAMYLFFLGWKALREKQTISAESLAKIKLESESLKQGVITEALNPKTALFFLALIPQFINPTGSVAFQFFVLGTTSVILNTTVDLLVVFSSDFLIAQLRRSKFAANSFKYVSSAGYIGLGLLALRTVREARS